MSVDTNSRKHYYISIYSSTYKGIVMATSFFKNGARLSLGNGARNLRTVTHIRYPNHRGSFTRRFNPSAASEAVIA